MTKDKRYPFFDLFATKSNEYAVEKAIELHNFYANVWPKFSKYMASGSHLDIYNSQDYHQFSHGLLELYDLITELKADKHNCDIQKEVKEKESLLGELAYRIKLTDFDYYEEQLNELKEKMGQVVTKKINEMYQELPAAIKSFKKSLDNRGMRQYSTLLADCKKFLDVENDAEKYQTFLSIANVYKAPGISSVNPHCKWDRNEYDSFAWKMVIYAANIPSASA